MWKLNKIEARNLCTFRELNYTLTQGVTTLVFGDNRDNDSQRSNGSGKSALIEAIALILTGSPLRKVRTEEIINDRADECYLSALLTNTSTGEELTVERTLLRKGASVVAISIGGQPVALPGVDSANRFLLDKLGITKEEVYNNFVLSKYKYQEFLGSSDSQKKEIINRFSNGILVDQAVARVAEDLKPVEEEARDQELKLAAIQGRIDMLSEQIREQEASRAERERTRTERIASMQDIMAAKRALVREKHDAADALSGRLPEIDRTDVRLRELEKGESSLEASLLGIRTLLSPLGIVPGDWTSVIARKKTEVAQQQQRLESLAVQQAAAAQRLDERATAHDRLRGEFRDFTLQADSRREEFETRMSEVEKDDRTLSEDLVSQRKRKYTLTQAVESLKNKLSGTVVCPRCRHTFLVSDREFDVEQGREELRQTAEQLDVESKQLAETYARIERVDAQRDALRHSQEELSVTLGRWKQRVAEAESQAFAARTESERLNRMQRQITDAIEELTAAIGGVRQRMFDEAFDRLEGVARSWERQREQLLSEAAAAEGALAALEESLQQLRECHDTTISQRESLKIYQAQSREALLCKEAVDEKLHRLREQQERFVQFKTYLANTKIEALARITNEFLEGIGSDIRIRFSGYTLLRSGKVREKISISLVRDGVDCGSFGKFSAGEAARVNLSTILAMQKLVNAGCEADKGLDLLVLDEIVEAVDEDGLQAMFGALNSLGITALVVSHGNIAESYPHKLIIRKENGVSRIEQ